MSMKGEGQKARGTTLRKYLRGEMKSAEFRRLYKKADIELRVALEITKAREAKKMSQGELADALRTKQQTVSRIELGAQNVTIETLDRIARALGRELQVRLVENSVMEKNLFLTKIEKGLRQADSKKTVSHKKMKHKMKSWSK
jgi:transcriptional regulator with XRE-family HTH domain